MLSKIYDRNPWGWIKNNFYCIKSFTVILTITTRQGDVVVTSQRRLFVRPSDVAGTSQMKHPMTSRWNFAKTSQWYVSTTSYLERHNNVSKGRNDNAPSLRLHDVSNKSQMKHPTTSQWYVTKTSQWYVSTTSH